MSSVDVNRTTPKLGKQCTRNEEENPIRTYLGVHNKRCKSRKNKRVRAVTKAPCGTGRDKNVWPAADGLFLCLGEGRYGDNFSFALPRDGNGTGRWAAICLTGKDEKK